MSPDAKEAPAEVFYEKRKYPLLEEGVYPVMCVKAELKDANPEGQYYKEGDKNIILHWEVREPSYTDPDDPEHKERKYRLFSRPLGLAFGERANLAKIFKKLTDLDINDFKEQVPAKLDLGNGRFKEGFRIRFDHTMLQYMECSVVVQHQEWNGELRANIDSYATTAVQRKANADSLAPAVREKRAAQNQDMHKQVEDVAAELGGETFPGKGATTNSIEVPKPDVHSPQAAQQEGGAGSVEQGTNSGSDGSQS